MFLTFVRKKKLHDYVLITSCGHLTSLLANQWKVDKTKQDHQDITLRAVLTGGGGRLSAHPACEGRLGGCTPSLLPAAWCRDN